MRPVRYDQKEIAKYLKEGYWDKSILSDYWDKNARDRPDNEALVDSTGSRLTWVEAKREIERIALATVACQTIRRSSDLGSYLKWAVEDLNL